MKLATYRTPAARLAVLARACDERAVPRCRHFGQCGGCQLQDIDYAAQVQLKKAMLAELLPQAPAITVHAADPWEYRNRARLRVENGQIGYSRHSSNAFLPVSECPIVSPLIWRVASTLQSLGASGSAGLPAGTSSVEIFTNHDETEVQLAVQLGETVSTVDRDAPAAFRGICARLSHTVPQLVGAGLLVAATPDHTQSRRVQESQRVEIAQWGTPTLHYSIAGRHYTVTRNAFFQVNRWLTGEMVHLVTHDAHGRTAWDLFAGAGLFSVALTETFDQVIAVEIGEPAATDLTNHLRGIGPGHQAIRSTVQSFLETAIRRRAAIPDFVVVDPPRAGLNPQILQALSQIAPPQLIYVSCDAGTFARDARTLLNSGYTLAALHLLDVFPQTDHTETIALFRR